MPRYLPILLMVAFTLNACAPKSTVDKPAETMTVQSPQEYVNPYPLQETPSASNPDTSANTNQPAEGSVYPAPVNENPAVALNPDLFVDVLDVPAPVGGNAVITGRLVSAGENGDPYITSLYLAAAKINDDLNQPPQVNFSIKTDPLARQELGSGKFAFTDIAPGKYAIVVWTPGETFFLEDSSGTTYVFDVNADELKDLGVISIE
jgi:hypothetical protein